MSVNAKNFYVTGGTLQRDAACYVERRADAELYDALLRGRFCYVLTSRQMGKSSLMVRTAVRLREEGVTVAALDLTAIGQNLNPEQWYNGLLSQVGQRLDLEDEIEEFAYEHKNVGPLQRWMRALREIALERCKGKVVVFIDEIDVVRSLPFSTDEFFAGVREFYNRRSDDPELERLTFCLLGVAAPSDLIRDTRTTPFNIGQRIELNDFTQKDAEPLAQGLLREEGEAKRLLKRILYWTNGHPFLTQRLCRAAAEDSSINNANDVDKLCNELFFTNRAKERDDNLLFVRERILRSEADIAGLLELYRRARRGKRVKDDETNTLVTILRLSGIARAENGSLKVRNRIYQKVFDEDWVKANMPDADLKRQRTAFYRGVMQASAVALAVVGVILVLAFNLKKQYDRNRILLYASQMGLAHQEWKNGNVGRVRELLENQRPAFGQEDLRGFEWSYLWRLSNNEIKAFQNLGPVEAIAVSPDGKRLAVASLLFVSDVSRSKVRMFDLAAEQPLFELNNLEGRVFSLAFSPDGKMLASGGSNNLAVVSDAASGKELFALRNDAVVYAVAFSPDGKLLAAGSGDDVKIWDVAAKREPTVLKGHTKHVHCIAYSPDGKTLASGSWDLSVKIWDTTKGKEAASFILNRGQLHSVVFSPDGKTLAATSKDTYANVKLWDTEEKKEKVMLFGHKDQVWCSAFSPDGKILATGGRDTAVRLWDPASGQEIGIIRGHEGLVSSLSFSPDGKILFAGGHDGTVRLWDLAEERGGREWRILNDRKDSICAVAFSPDGKFLAAGNGRQYGLRSENKVVVLQPGNLKLLGISTGKELFALTSYTNPVRSVSFSPDGRTIAAASAPYLSQSQPGTAEIFDASTGSKISTLKGHSAEVLTAVFSPDGRMIATGSSDKSVKCWDARTGKELSALNGHGGGVFEAAFSPDGKTLAALSEDGRVKLWDVDKRREKLSIEEDAEAIAFSPDGELLAVGTKKGFVKILDAHTGRQLYLLKGHTDEINCIVFSPDGKTLASGSTDATVKLWNTASGIETITLNHYADMVLAIAFSPDGKTLAVGSWDRTIKLYQAAAEDKADP